MVISVLVNVLLPILLLSLNRVTNKHVHIWRELVARAYFSRRLPLLFENFVASHSLRFDERFRVFFSAIVVPMDLYTHLWNPLEALEGASWDETALKVISMNFLKIVTNYYQTTNHSVWWVRKMYGRWNSGSNQFDAPNWHLPSRWRRIQSTQWQSFHSKIFNQDYALESYILQYFDIFSLVKFNFCLFADVICFPFWRRLIAYFPFEWAKYGENIA